MIITYHGKQALKLAYGDLVIAYNPISKDSKLKEKPAKFGADLVLISARHPDYNGIDTVTYGERNPFVVQGPGEYEHKDILVQGFGMKTTIGKDEYINTAYKLKLDGIEILLLGHIGSLDIDAAIYEELGTTDIVVLPIGGGDVLTAKDAHKLATKFTPGIIIPIDYGDGRDKDALENFVKDSGKEKVKPVDKLTLKAKDLLGREGDVQVLASS